MSFLFNTFIYNPLYNGLVFLIDVMPGHEVGWAVVILTLIVKVLLYPLTKKAVLTQKAMASVDEEVKVLREKYKDNKEEQAKRLMTLYREKGISPFASFFSLLLQIPVILALYFVFASGLPEIMVERLYTFVSVPGSVDMLFLGFFDMAAKSWPLALLAGLSQFIHAYISVPHPKKPSGTPSFQEDFARSMSIQVKYVFPVIIVFVAHSLSAAVALYWAAGNIFAIGQEFLIRRHLPPTSTANRA